MAPQKTREAWHSEISNAGLYDVVARYSSMAEFAGPIRQVDPPKAKRGGSALVVSLADADSVPARTQDLIALEGALLALAKLDERKSRLVVRYFGGLTSDEAA